MITYYTRNVDCNNGTQIVETNDGLITAQWFEARQGRYTGNGNPELVGKPIATMRGMGFRKVSQAMTDRLLEASVNTMLMEEAFARTR
jgi:hypothetical protein